MKFYGRVDISGAVNMASPAQESFVIGSAVENNDATVDTFIVYANADFRNNVILGSSSLDTVTVSGNLTASNNLVIGTSSSDVPLFFSNTPIRLLRNNAAAEGGQLEFARASDNTVKWYIDSYGTGDDSSLRVFDNSASVALTVKAITRDITASSGLSATYFVGDGSRLTGITSGGGVSSAAVSGAITGAFSNYPGNSIIQGNLTVSGNTTFGDSSSDTITINGNTYIGNVTGNEIRLTSSILRTYPNVNFTTYIGDNASFLFKNPVDDSTTLQIRPATNTVSSSVTITTAGDVAVNGGDITSTATTFNLLNSTVTSLNVGGAATTMSVGAGTGATTVNNRLTASNGITTTTISASSTLQVGGNSTIAGNESVLGSITSSGDIIARGDIYIGKRNSGASDTLIIGKAALTGGTGNGNLAIGANALQVATTANQNTAVGLYTLQQNITGSNNTAIGRYALNKNLSSRNTAVGEGALFNFLGTQANSFYNTALGDSALYQLQQGGYNTGLGYNAGSAVTSGSSNVFLGSFDGTGYTTVSNYMFFSDGVGNLRFLIDNAGRTTFSGSISGSAISSSGNLLVGGNLTVGGAQTTIGNFNINGTNINLGNASSDIITSVGQFTASAGISGSSLIVGGDSTLAGNLTVSGSNIILGDSSADVTTINSQLTASAATRINGPLTVANTASFTTVVTASRLYVQQFIDQQNLSVATTYSSITPGVVGYIQFNNGLRTDQIKATDNNSILSYSVGNITVGNTALNIITSGSITLGGASSDIVTAKGQLTASNGLTVTGAVNLSNTSILSSSSPISASYYVGDGSRLTGITAGGGVSATDVSGAITGAFNNYPGSLIVQGNFTVSGNTNIGNVSNDNLIITSSVYLSNTSVISSSAGISASHFVGDGSRLTNLPAGGGGITGTGISAITVLSQADYDNLSSPSSTTLYIITG